MCGHRFVSDIDAGAIQGICYEGRRNLSNFEIVRPCLDLVSAGARSGGQFAIRQGQMMWCMGGIDATYLVSGYRGEGGEERGEEGKGGVRRGKEG